MAEILSQSEIDSLLNALSSGTIEEDVHVSEPTKGVKVYDFKHPDRFSKDQTRSLQMLHEHFSRLFSTSLSTYLRTITEVKLVSVDQLSYDEFIRSIPNPTCVNLIDM
ncbi:MAG: flagellar motor switch protein FliM, partial [Candidatus Omnitrophica bacterium]|nr:flagellar motor switch protein FliM [Candidatus Omnitrophota bacterium]